MLIYSPYIEYLIYIKNKILRNYMNEELFIKRINNSIKNKAYKLTKDYANGQTFKEIIKQPLLKNLSRVIHIEY